MYDKHPSRFSHGSCRIYAKQSNIIRFTSVVHHQRGRFTFTAMLSNVEEY